MSKGKKEKFAEVKTFPNVFQNFTPMEPKLTCMGEDRDMKGKWNEAYFKNSNPIVLELACGKGDYTVNLAQAFPKKNFLGVDVKGNRIWTGAKKALGNELSNVGFVRTRIEQLAEFFDKNEISEIWITFPDPYPKKRRANKRLTSPRFLEIYSNVLQPGGTIHLKTDATKLFEYSLEILEEQNIEPQKVIRDVHGMDGTPEVLQILTYYEKMHLEEGKRIKYVRFTLN